MGELDLAGAPLADGALLVATADAELVVVDLCSLSFIDCAGLGVLLAADDRLRKGGGRLVLIHAARQVQHLLELTGANRRLELAWGDPDEPGTAPARQTDGAHLASPGAVDAR